MRRNCSRKKFGDANFNVYAVASSGLPISNYTSSNPAVLSVTDSTVTIIAPGTADITATQNGTVYFNSASTFQTVTVNKGVQTITFNNLPEVSVTDSPIALAATASSGLPVSYTSSNPSVATVSGSILTIVGLGSSTITALQAGNTNYNAATSLLQLLTVKQSQSINFSALSPKNYGDPNFMLTASSSSALAVTFRSSNSSVAIITGNVVSIVGGGSTIITASQSGNNTYNAASESYSKRRTR